MAGRTDVLLQHGWAGSAAHWSAWCEQAPPGFACECLDRGYFGGRVDWSDRGARDAPPIAVAHSVGLHLLPGAALRGARLLVVAGGFRCFHGDDPAAAHRSQRRVRRMLEQLRREPEAVLRRFYAECSLPEKTLVRAPADPDPALLQQDLRLLDRSALDPAAVAALPAVLLLHGDADRVVPVERALELNRLLPNSRLTVIAGAGHALHITHITECWQAIRKAWYGMPERHR